METGYKIIVGSRGEGGGQIFRTTLTLSMCLGIPVHIKNIRAGRAKTGLLRQHLTCLRAAQEICNAEVTGDVLGSMEVTFRPGEIKAGKYRFAVGSAGSTSLVFQTILMPLLRVGEESEVYLEGGTHNGSAPSFDYIEQCFKPVLEKIGYDFDMKLERYGFFPAGGGAWCAKIKPDVEVKKLELMELGPHCANKAIATSARLPEHVTERELNKVKRKCGWNEDALQQNLVESVGPGNLLSLQVQYGNIMEVIEIVGEKGMNAERVAGNAIAELKRFEAAKVPVGEHLADQLLLPLALGKGGRFLTLTPSLHLKTNIEVITLLMDIEIQLKELSEGQWEVYVKPQY